ncbi:hypothetical protein [Methanohalophilus mahii]|uniref:Uncharacterized protein n=1 Tax=Methanohalophilus mahii (strain ATCC 35705 / DSM 5219 / SLP) TaxID=547558 RepID=D5E8J1_METMS|nr:hypothetical protein [Methanohalophilus mahii]ADE37479.1 hypothetical protein Mmah_1984 [Methanohalophilus mahii DSM 5219]
MRYDKIYLEFTYPIEHYFTVATREEKIWDIVLPLIFGAIGYFLIIYFDFTIPTKNIDQLFPSVIILLSILIGFTISTVTILANSRDELKVETDRIIEEVKINLYQLMNIWFIITLFSEIIALVFNMVILLLASYGVPLVTNNINLIIAINIYLISQVLLLNVRNITNFYFILHGIPNHQQE